MIRKSIILSKFCEECIFIIYYSFLSLGITMQLCSSGVVLQSPTFLKSILIWAFFYLKFMHFSLKYWVEEWVEWFKFFCDSRAWFHRLTVWSCHFSCIYVDMSCSSGTIYMVLRELMNQPYIIPAINKIPFI